MVMCRLSLPFSQLNTINGSYFKVFFFKCTQISTTTTATVTPKEKWTRNSNKLLSGLQHEHWLLLQQAYIIPSVRQEMCECTMCCVCIYNTYLHAEGRLIIIELISYYKSDYFAFNREIVVSVAPDNVCVCLFGAIYMHAYRLRVQSVSRCDNKLMQMSQIFMSTVFCHHIQYPK